jgi:hypothetical protein
MALRVTALESIVVADATIPIPAACIPIAHLDGASPRLVLGQCKPNASRAADERRVRRTRGAAACRRAGWAAARFLC